MLKKSPPCALRALTCNPLVSTTVPLLHSSLPALPMCQDTGGATFFRETYKEAFMEWCQEVACRGPMLFGQNSVSWTTVLRGNEQASTAVRGFHSGHTRRQAMGSPSAKARLGKLGQRQRCHQRSKVRHTITATGNERWRTTSRWLVSRFSCKGPDEQECRGSNYVTP